MVQVIQTHKTLKMFLTLFMALCLMITMMFTTSIRVHAVGTLVGVSAATVYGLLVALGVVTVGAGVYALSQDYPYISSIFGEDDVFDPTGSITSANKIMEMIPDGYYFTDGAGNYFVSDGVGGYVPVTSVSQLAINSEYIATQTYVPQNVALIPSVLEGWRGYLSDVTEVWNKLGQNCWYVPYCVYQGEVLVAHWAFSFNSSGATILEYSKADAMPQSGMESSYFTQYATLNFSATNFIEPCFAATSRAGVPVHSGMVSGSDWTVPDGGTLGNVGFRTVPQYGSLSFYNSEGLSHNFSDQNFKSSTSQNGLLVCPTRPTFTLEVDKDKLDGTIVTVGDPHLPNNGDGDDDDDYKLVPPSYWEIFTSLADLMSGDNNGTTLGDFINNNYNYNTVDVDINVPERFDFNIIGDLHIKQDVNLSGGINVDISINDKTELPSISEGDGEGFFSANVVDVFAGLTSNNPVMGLIKGLFASVDPALVSIFSVSVSLMLLLALWKLIRG